MKKIRILAAALGTIGLCMLLWFNHSTVNAAAPPSGENSAASFFIDCTGGAWNEETLNRYLGGSCFTVVKLDCDAMRIRQLSDFALENPDLQNLVISLDLRAAQQNGEGVSGGELFFSKFVYRSSKTDLLWPRKIETVWGLNTAEPQAPGILAELARSSRDVEPIGTLDGYLSRHDFSQTGEIKPLQWLQQLQENLNEIRQRCKTQGVRLLVLCPPAYHTQVDAQQLGAFRNALAEVTDFWDFTLTPVSYDPRYFYDPKTFRKGTGDMALARVFADHAVYHPFDFGQYIPKGSLPGVPDVQEVPEERYSVRVPILMYHHLGENVGQDVIQPQVFSSHMEALLQAGYNPVAFADLFAYVRQGKELPKNPVVITFDDGYLSNYELSYPILQQYQIKATIFAIGSSMGKDTYKDTGSAMLPHFSWEQAQQMNDSGLVSVQSHGYNLHEISGLDPEPIRKGVWQRPGESDEDYVRFLRQDLAAEEQALGYAPTVLAYPYGRSSTLAEQVFHRAGIEATLTTVPKVNTIIKGIPQSLHLLGRYSIAGTVTPEQLLRLLTQ